MARQFTMTNGTLSVDLIDATSPGMIPPQGGLGPTRVTPDMNISGGVVQSYEYPPQVERWRLNVLGSSHDNLASQTQDFWKLLRLARQYNSPLTPWQNTPVYLTAQTTNETNTRYAMVLGAADWLMPDLYAFPYENNNELETLGINIVREALWRNAIPNTMPAALNIGCKAFNDVQFAGWADITDTPDNITRNTTAALSGEYGMAVTSDGSTDAYIMLNNDSGVSSSTIEFEFNPNSIDMAAASGVTIAEALNSSGAPLWRVFLREGNSLRLRSYDDGGSLAFQGSTAISVSAKITIKVEFVASSGPGNNDGTVELFIDDASEIAQSTIDSDTLTHQNSTIGARDYTGTVTGGTLYFDDIRFADSTDEDWHYTIDFEDAAVVPVGNSDQKTVLTHVFNYDDNLTAFSENLVGMQNATLFEVAGSTPALNDIVYIGSTDGPHFSAGLEIATNLVASGEIKLEYWNGAWTNISDYKEPLENATADVIHHNNKTSDWVTTSINSVSAFWLRLRISGLSSWTTSPVLSRALYQATGNYIEIHSDRINGDEAALIRVLMYQAQRTGGDAIKRIIIGLKSRGLGDFDSVVNAGGDNPSGWTVSTTGADTTIVTDDRASSGSIASCDFTTTQTMSERVVFTIGGGTKKAAFEGEYRIYLKTRQVNGSAGDVVFRLDLDVQTIIQGEEKSMLAIDQTGPELVDMGKYSIAPTGIRGNESAQDDSTDTDIKFNVNARSDNGTTPDFEIYGVVLIPVDEWSAVFLPPGISNDEISHLDFVSVDGGVVRRGAVLGDYSGTPANADTGVPVVDWLVDGILPEIRPDTQARLYFLFAANGSNNSVYANDGLSVMAKLYTIEQWLHLRGAS